LIHRLRYLWGWVVPRLISELDRLDRVSCAIPSLNVRQSDAKLIKRVSRRPSVLALDTGLRMSFLFKPFLVGVVDPGRAAHDNHQHRDGRNQPNQELSDARKKPNVPACIDAKIISAITIERIRCMMVSWRSKLLTRKLRLDDPGG
jgi:hypothetical protein